MSVVPDSFIPMAAIERAAEVLATVVPPTPVLTSPALDARLGLTVFAKAEARQRAGAFKFRGAYNRLSQISESDRSLGVVAVSSGNHGAAVACSAQMLSMTATIFVPADVPDAKRQLIESFGGAIETFDRNLMVREGPALEFAARTGATFVHPYEDREVMAGQGTTALELHNQVGPLDYLLVPISGGGLMAGCASAMRTLDPHCVMIGVEPEGANDTQLSFASGERTRVVADTIADGLTVAIPGENTFPINRQLVSEVLTVSDQAMVDAMRLAQSELAIRLEPSGAAVLAALTKHAHQWSGRRVGIVLSGGNIDTARYEALNRQFPE